MHLHCLTDLLWEKVSEWCDFLSPKRRSAAKWHKKSIKSTVSQRYDLLMGFALSRGKHFFCIKASINTKGRDRQRVMEEQTDSRTYLTIPESGHRLRAMIWRMRPWQTWDAHTNTQYTYAQHTRTNKHTCAYGTQTHSAREHTCAHIRIHTAQANIHART